MSPDDPKDVLARYVHAVWTQADPEAARHYRFVSALAPPLDLEQQIRRLHDLRAALPDAELHVDAVVADGDFVAFRSTMREPTAVPVGHRRHEAPGHGAARRHDPHRRRAVRRAVGRSRHARSGHSARVTITPPE
jgi:hypothetical protein